MAAKKNYNKISTEKATEEKVETVETVEAVEAVEEAVEAKPDFVEGKVVKCTRLNVRKNPKKDKDADIIKVITVNTRIKIDLDKSNKTWYKLANADGYVMKEYIELCK